jgi:hypothetical protein
MKGLTSARLGRACRIFLERAYPEGEHTIPPPRRVFLAIAPGQPLEGLLVPPLCRVLPAAGGGVRGYAFRLGSAAYPHLKLQVVGQGDGCVFSVDTHDTVFLEPGHPDAARWGQLQVVNRQLKEQIERAWEAAGLLTFNGLLRRELAGG